MIQLPKSMKTLIPLLLTAAMISHAPAQTPKPTPAQTAEALYRQGQMAEKSGDPDAARTAYTEALKANPNHAQARFSLGQLKISAPTLISKARENKFGAVPVPEYRLEAASLEESLAALSTIVEKQSKNEVTPNFIIQDPKGTLAETKISLNLKAMPAKAVLQYVLDMAGAKARFDEHAILIVPR